MVLVTTEKSFEEFYDHGGIFSDIFNELTFITNFNFEKVCK